MNTSRVIVALDYPSAGDAKAFVETVDPSLCKLKVGKELFTRAGPDFVASLVKKGFDVFLDLKFHDIPNTTAQAVAAAADLGVWMVNVHASGGRRMMEAAMKKLDEQKSGTLLTAVTVLTSMTGEDLVEIGITSPPAEQVERLAALAHDAGLHGVVCSAHEAGAMAERFGEDFLRVTPGIRPADAGAGDDQRRVLTPAAAVGHGSSYLVIGRPITRSGNPSSTLLAIKEEIGDH